MSKLDVMGIGNLFLNVREGAFTLGSSRENLRFVPYEPEEDNTAHTPAPVPQQQCMHHGNKQQVFGSYGVIKNCDLIGNTGK